MIDTKDIRERMLKEFGIENLPEKDQERLLESVSQNLLEALFLAVLQKLPSGMKNSFTEATERGDKEAVEKIMRTHIPDLDTFIQEEIRKEIAELKRLQEKNLRK